MKRFSVRMAGVSVSTDCFSVCIAGVILRLNNR